MSEAVTALSKKDSNPRNRTGRKPATGKMDKKMQFFKKKFLSLIQHITAIICRKSFLSDGQFFGAGMTPRSPGVQNCIQIIFKSMVNTYPPH